VQGTIAGAHHVVHHDRHPDDTRVDRAQLRRLPFLCQATAFRAAAAAAATAAATATTVPDDRQPETVRRRQADPRPGVQPDRRLTSRVPDTGDHQARQRVSVSI